nr:MAG TPA: hypothetical protein [Bacteriophage sp.]
MHHYMGIYYDLLYLAYILKTLFLSKNVLLQGV